MTNSHNSSPAYYGFSEQVDAYAREYFGTDYATMAQDPEERNIVSESDVEDAEEFAVHGGYGWARLIDPAYG